MPSKTQSTLCGSETPRLWTPPLRELTNETTHGYRAILFATAVLGWKLYPWQKWLLIHGLEILEDGTYRFRTVIVLVARQNGKTRLSQLCALFALFGMEVEMVVGTSVDLDTAREVWDGCREEIDDNPVLSALALKPVLRAGSEAIRLTGKRRYKLRATGKGRGLTGDLLLLDELREHHNWKAWSAITKTLMARPSAQAWCFSNAGDAVSVVLRYLRLKAHEALGDPDGIVAATNPASILEAAEKELASQDSDDDDLDESPAETLARSIAGESLGLFEWSAPPGCSIWDREGWAYANPSLGHGTITERAIAAAASTDPEWEFRTEVLCQWPDGALNGIFKAGKWEETTVPYSKTAPNARVVLGLDVSWDRSKTSVAIVGESDANPEATHFGVIASRAGTDWVVPYLSGKTNESLPNFDGVVVQERGAPASSLIEDLEKAGVPVIRWSGAGVTSAFGIMYDLLAAPDPLLLHMPQPILDVAAAAAVPKQLGDALVIDRKASPVDVSGLIAVQGALWAHRTEIAARSAYEDNDLLIM
ncbi:hypothetical protein K0651_01905 [Ornithinimicrobium sp. Arc0846-15]|nr:hypothetical protein [Ornithinimicrobium laminariae]